MNVIKPYAKLVHFVYNAITEFNFSRGVECLQKIEFCGRISHRSEESITLKSWESFIKAIVLSHGDWSIVEHASVTVDAIMDRGITHEWVRHRLFSFTQESTRFVNYEKKMPPSFIDPTPHIPYPVADGPDLIKNLWKNSIDQSEAAYRCLLAAGASPQLARSVFPNALASRILTTGNLRNWRHFLIMRTTKESHPQMREITIPLLLQFQECIPLLFDDITPNSRQADNLRLPR